MFTTREDNILPPSVKTSTNIHMLQNLSIRDFILIEKLDLDFDDGFCVITGQTGAGKSILLDAILFALGGKFGSEIIRTGQESAHVTLTFSTSANASEYLSEYDINSSEELIIKRIQYAGGRKKFFINDHIVTQKIVSDLFDYLLEIHGQHNHTALLNISSHLEILDQFCGDSNLTKEVADLYKSWQSLSAEIAAIDKEKDTINKEIEYLTHICQEFDDLAIQEGEEEELALAKKLLQTREKEIKLIDSVTADIEATNIEQVIARAQRNLSKSENTDLYDSVNLNLDEIYNKIEEVKSALNHILHSFELSDYNLADVEDRLYAIRDLARKHGCTPSDLEQFMKKAHENLRLLESKIKGSFDLQEKMIKAKEEYFHKAKILSASRQTAGKDLESKTMQELSMLDMKKAEFFVEIKSKEENASARGIDDVRFLASTNPGMPKAPIDKIASGGELSRFMLSFRAALFDNCLKQTIIFDEIDVGISGSVADSIGQRLKILSEVAQVIVITHQPQVAGYAKQHILVKKTQGDHATLVNIDKLDFDGRSSELARMISGKEITDNSLAAAKELIL